MIHVCIRTSAVLAVLGASFAAAQPPTYASGNTFYIDGEVGDDRNAGTSPRTAWRSLARVNDATFSPGARILLKAGTSYKGVLRLHGSGESGRPIIVDRYGAGPKPRILAPLGQGAVVLLYNVEYWEVSNLELTGGRTGVFVYLKEFGVGHHLHFKDLHIHDIRGNLRGDDGGFLLKREGETTWFDDLLIEGCRIEHVDRNGILHTDYPTLSKKHHSQNVVIRGNRLSDIGGDGIFILGCDGALIERNVLRYAHQRVGRQKGERACAGIWPQRCNNTVIQFNEVSHTAVGGKTVWDSEAFDDDIGCRGTVFQYNYSHDNAGGFLLACGGARGTVVRYNISQNDAVATFSLEGNGTGNITIYNNVFYVGPDMTVNMTRNTFGIPRDVRYFNNIFYAAGAMTYKFGSVEDAVFANNLYFGNHRERPVDRHALTVEPLLVRPGGGGNGRNTADVYKLLPGSPCRGAGRIVAGNGGRDFWGDPVPVDKRPAVGAHNP
ncbi:MAG: hypothetical protein GXP31_07100 [Kiritimatiellaeota bacterium]|nr:hypothetical protein [Kiritimatiellota bacterium]